MTYILHFLNDLLFKMKDAEISLIWEQTPGMADIAIDPNCESLRSFLEETKHRPLRYIQNLIDRGVFDEQSKPSLKYEIFRIRDSIKDIELTIKPLFLKWPDEIKKSIEYITDQVIVGVSEISETYLNESPKLNLRHHGFIAKSMYLIDEITKAESTHIAYMKAYYEREKLDIEKEDGQTFKNFQNGFQHVASLGDLEKSNIVRKTCKLHLAENYKKKLLESHGVSVYEDD